MSTRHADYRRSQSANAADSAAVLISVERLTRLKQIVKGTFLPSALPEIADYLASDAGQIDYRLSGNIESDQSARRQLRLQCIISGWFDVLDAVTLVPSRFELDIKSRLVLVSSDDDLPPLEDEAEDEDFIVCGQDFDIKAHVQEEILLVLPTTTPRQDAHAGAALPKTLRRTLASGDATLSEQVRESPFATLRTLKKTS